MQIKPSQKLILIITLLLVLIVLAVVIYSFLFRPIIKPTKEVVPQEEIIKKQLEVLQPLPQPLSEKEIEKQMKELEQNQGLQPLSEEEINKQLKELNKRPALQ